MRNQDRRTLSRRSFLKGVGALTAGLTLREPVDGLLAGTSERQSAAKSMGFMVDLTRCIGCRKCEPACKKANGLPVEMPNPPRLEAKTWTFVDFREDVPRPSGQPLPVKRQCMHCLEPACASACPVAALYKTSEPDGPIAYRANRCIGCRYCMIACPFGIPRFEWDSGLRPVIGKCTMCIQRLQAGQQPACVDVCPTGALKYGERDALLAEARGRIQADPDRYVDHIYGESEVGGTSVLYLSGVPFEELGFRTDLPDEPLPALTWEVMSKIPALVVGLGVVLGISSFLTRRQRGS